MTFSFLEAFEITKFDGKLITTVMQQTSDGCKDLTYLVEFDDNALQFADLNSLLLFLTGKKTEQSNLSKQQLTFLKENLDGKYDS
jgi:hypothetical protein